VVGRLLQNEPCNDDGCHQLGPCVECQVVLNVVEIMLPEFIMLHIRIESYGNFCEPRPSVKTARQDLGDGIFRA
jgi:hypothetical protein